jgi:hypothetical protein
MMCSNRTTSRSQDRCAGADEANDHGVIGTDPQKPRRPPAGPGGKGVHTRRRYLANTNHHQAISQLRPSGSWTECSFLLATYAAHMDTYVVIENQL